MPLKKNRFFGHRLYVASEPDYIIYLNLSESTFNYNLFKYFVCLESVTLFSFDKGENHRGKGFFKGAWNYAP